MCCHEWRKKYTMGLLVEWGPMTASQEVPPPCQGLQCNRWNTFPQARGGGYRLLSTVHPLSQREPVPVSWSEDVHDRRSGLSPKLTNDRPYLSLNNWGAYRRRAVRVCREMVTKNWLHQPGRVASLSDCLSHRHARLITPGVPSEWILGLFRADLNARK
ncbi:hypothetical protein CEXT_684031 [Caerostris extrusa]|uniref:Uncharacterized protein n=1 Tax=Caerostris extrusa TaxID=172846 RepID=A0AAV4VLT7_CAEEX|nr:hypothetical protein CEXT_684031 [Caerostris extrusa]